MNHTFKQRYDRFIQHCFTRPFPKHEECGEQHHIVPKCLGGTDDATNLIQLTLREHFIAHHLLWKAYPGHLGLASAFLQMANKNPRAKKGEQGILSSKTYASLKEQSYSLISEFMRDKVFVKDSSGNIVELTKEQYKELKHKYKFHTTGKVSVRNKETGEMEWIDSSEYQPSIHLFHTTGKVSVRNKETGEMEWIDSSAYHANKDKYVARSAYSEGIKYQFLNTDTGEVVKMSKAEAKQINLQLKKKVFKQQVSHRYKCKCLETGNIIVVSASEYDPKKHQHLNGNTIKCLDLTDGNRKAISVDEYYTNQTRYTTSTKGKVLVKDGAKSKLISKQEFTESGAKGHTAGMVTVQNKVTKKFEHISTECYNNNKSQYDGPNKGKMNVIDMKSGIRKQIPVNEFDPLIHCKLGVTSQYFKCCNKATGKLKNISIFEWALVQDKYEIIDFDKYEKAKKKFN